MLPLCRQGPNVLSIFVRVRVQPNPEHRAEKHHGSEWWTDHSGPRAGGRHWSLNDSRLALCLGREQISSCLSGFISQGLFLVYISTSESPRTPRGLVSTEMVPTPPRPSLTEQVWVGMCIFASSEIPRTASAAGPGPPLCSNRQTHVLTTTHILSQIWGGGTCFFFGGQK